MENEFTYIQLQDYLSKARNKRLFVRMPLAVNFEIYDDKIIDTISNIELWAKDGLEVIAVYKSMLVATRIEDKNKAIKLKMLLEHTHMDNLPYMDIVISLPISKENAAMLKNSEEKDKSMFIIINKYDDIIKKESELPTKGKREDYDAAYEHDKKKKKIFRLKIVYNKNGCTASGHCVLSDNIDFTLDEDFRADLIGGTEMSGPVKRIYTKIIETDSPHLVINAAKTCTPKVIAVIDLDTEKRVAP